MALEATVLSPENIRHLLKIHYGVRVLAARRLPFGSANCYRIEDEQKSYFLKEFQACFQREDVVREAELAETLAARGIPTARFYRTRSGEWTFEFEGHALCLEEYIDGRPYGYDGFPPALLPQAAALLGKLHIAMRGCDLPQDMGATWFSPEAALQSQNGYDALLSALEARPSDPCYEKIRADLRFKRDLLRTCSAWMPALDGVTYSPTHGDYQGCQLIGDGREIKAVIDFSSARTLPVTWELLRSFAQTSVFCRKEARIDIPGLCAYVRAYLPYAPLTAQDLAAAPYIYLYQLARSKFGYTQYLKTESEDRENLLQFAFWRTRLCRELFDHAREIAGALSELLPLIYSTREE
jgi:Ser/Thr protein kinase RdoA (MazF antagonist)